MSSSRSTSSALEPSSDSTPHRGPKTKRTGPYSRNCQQHLIDHGVYPVGYEYYDGQVPPPPSNLNEITERLARPRASLSSSKFSDEDFRKFRRADIHAAKEKQVSTSVIPIIEGNTGNPKCVSGGIPFTNLKPLTDGTLPPGNPDIYYGARPEQLAQQVRKERSGHITPSTQEDLPILPNFMVAVKGPDGTPAVAGRQASYDGALGARGMHSLQSYGQKDPFFDNNAYTITSIYQAGQLKMYTSHVFQSPGSGRRPEYHMHQLRQLAMIDTAEAFRQGATAYRNARDWAKEKRDEAIRQANERANELQTETIATAPSTEPASTSGTTIERGLTTSRRSRNEQDETSSATAPARDSYTPPPELRLDAQATKRSSEQVKQPSPIQRKRQNRGGNAYKLLGHSEVESSGTSGLSQQRGDQILGKESESLSSEAEFQ